MGSADKVVECQNTLPNEKAQFVGAACGSIRDPCYISRRRSTRPTHPRLRRDRTPTHGHEPTRKTAMTAFREDWRRE
jgi:hypothetical protein